MCSLFHLIIKMDSTGNLPRTKNPGPNPSPNPSTLTPYGRFFSGGEGVGGPFLTPMKWFYVRENDIIHECESFKKITSSTSVIFKYV